MSFKAFVNKKIQFSVEFEINEFKDNLLADLSNIFLNNKEKAMDLIFESINFEKLNQFCNSIGYDKSTEFEINLKSKNINKILENLHELEGNAVLLTNCSQFDEIKNNIFNYILKTQRKNFDSYDVDLVFESRLNKLQNILCELALKVRKFNFKELKTIHLNPIYDFVESDLKKIEFKINDNSKFVFDCRLTDLGFIFNNLSIAELDSKKTEEVECLFQFLNNQKNSIYETFFFEYPKEKRQQLNQIKKETFWGPQKSLPKDITILEQLPSESSLDIWKIKKRNGQLVHLERIDNVTTDKN